MTTREAIGIVAQSLTDELAIVTTGYTSRDMQAIRDRKENFYMIGSMGIAASLGLGIALSSPKKRVVIFDGDGSVLMALGTLPMVGTVKPTNLVHLVFDNEAFASTGGQPTYSRSVGLDTLARTCGYEWVARADTPGTLQSAWEESADRLRKRMGPIFLLIKCTADAGPPSPRIALSPEEITRRFQETLFPEGTPRGSKEALYA